MSIPIGATSYVFRYLLSDPAKAPTLEALLNLAKDCDLDALQICENARPLSASPSEWVLLGRLAAKLNLQISLGCMTLDPETVVAYLDRVQAIGGKYLRIVLERDCEALLNLDQIHRFLQKVVPASRRRGIRLAIENHFDIPCRMLAEAAAAYPREAVGFCVDVANSLRNFEPTETVIDLLSQRAVCYHLKDYQVVGSNVGFIVSGRPFGQGLLQARSLLQRIVDTSETPIDIFLENWTPNTNQWERDVAEDARWLTSSISEYKMLLAAINRDTRKPKI